MIAITHEPLDHAGGRGQRAPEDLDRRAAIDHIATGDVDRAAAALREQALDDVVTDPLARGQVARRECALSWRKGLRFADMRHGFQTNAPRGRPTYITASARCTKAVCSMRPQADWV